MGHTQVSRYLTPCRQGLAAAGRSVRRAAHREPIEHRRAYVELARAHTAYLLTRIPEDIRDRTFGCDHCGELNPGDWRNNCEVNNIPWCASSREQGHDDVERDEGDIADAWLFYDDMVAERKANGRKTEGRYRQNFQTNRQNFETELASGLSYSLASSHADVEEFISQKWRPSEVSAGRVDLTKDFLPDCGKTAVVPRC